MLDSERFKLLPCPQVSSNGNNNNKKSIEYSSVTPLHYFILKKFCKIAIALVIYPVTRWTLEKVQSVQNLYLFKMKQLYLIIRGGNLQFPLRTNFE